MKGLLFFQVHKSSIGIAQKVSAALPISIESEPQQCPCRCAIGAGFLKNRRATPTFRFI